MSDKTDTKTETEDNRALSDDDLDEAKVSGGTGWSQSGQGGSNQYDAWHNLPDGSGSGFGE